MVSIFTICSGIWYWIPILLKKKKKKKRWELLFIMAQKKNKIAFCTFMDASSTQDQKSLLLPMWFCPKLSLPRKGLRLFSYSSQLQCLSQVQICITCFLWGTVTSHLLYKMICHYFEISVASASPSLSWPSCSRHCVCTAGVRGIW